jgi:predicted Zn-dependent protease
VTTDPAIAALRSTLSAHPDDHGARARLAVLLFEAGRAQEALAEATVVLGARPADVPMLRLAAAAAAALGAEQQAGAYRRLADAIGDEPLVPESAEAPDAVQVPEVPDSPADLLEQWATSEPIPEREVSPPGDE